MGDNMLAWQPDRLWLSLDFLAAGDVKSISANLFCVFPVLCKDGATQYAFVSVTVIDSLLLTVNSYLNKIEAIWVQTSAKPAMQVQWAETTVPTSSVITMVSAEVHLAVENAAPKKKQGQLNFFKFLSAKKPKKQQVEYST